MAGQGFPGSESAEMVPGPIVRPLLPEQDQALEGAGTCMKLRMLRTHEATVGVEGVHGSRTRRGSSQAHGVPGELPKPGDIGLFPGLQFYKVEVKIGKISTFLTRA
jgi:hypothetical protein